MRWLVRSSPVIVESWRSQPDMTGTNRQIEARFHIHALACPQLLCRILGYVAQRDQMVDSLRVDRKRDKVDIRFAIHDIDVHCAEILADKMRNIVTVNHIDLVFFPDALAVC